MQMSYSQQYYFLIYIWGVGSLVLSSLQRFIEKCRECKANTKFHFKDIISTGR